MQELVYLLRVGGTTKGDLQHRLMMAAPPSHVRISTLAPLSNHGYPAGSEGALLGITDSGLTIGVESDSSVPRAFVPWQNVSYVADGTALGAKAGAS